MFWISGGVRPGVQLLAGGVGERLEVGITDAEPSPDPGRLLVEWLPRPGDTYHARLYQEGTRYTMWVQGLGWYLVDPPARRIGLPVSENVWRRR